ncbi:thioredoxin domain-containing protein [Sphingomonas crusticola]|uniref:thioredoxin domain-containing protein n=1 Tax=Sphingomonas crusticola TaxID=1697973 RepID=UPI000E246DEF|nr:thioredoxin domain-containing protein [Sphingomonas crusticola]
MVRRFLIALSLVVLPAQLAAAPARDWSKVAQRLPSGAFVQGNPAARIKLVEFLSLTCPHCAHFEGEAIKPLTAKYIGTGLVSYEVRHAVRDSFDLAGSLLARCDGPQAFFTTLPRVFAQQDTWFARAQAWSQVEQAGGLPPNQILLKSAGGAGFDRVFGMAPAKMNACLTNKDEQALLTAMAGAAWNSPGFPGTPAFQINGRMQLKVREWVDLDRALAAALKTRTPVRKTTRR